jgi:hypothetical protein
LNVAAQAKLISKTISVSEENDVYTITSTVNLQGDYTRFIKRLMDVENYAAMKVPFVKESHLVSDDTHQRIVWIYLSSFPIQAKYYMRFDYSISEKKTEVDFHLIPKKGRYEEKHDFDKINGHMTIKVISGSPKNGQFSMKSTTQLKLKESAADIPEITINKLIFQTQWGLKVFSQ